MERRFKSLRGGSNASPSQVQPVRRSGNPNAVSTAAAKYSDLATQSPLMKGDRVTSLASGKSGVVEKANSRYIYIRWDKDKQMGYQTYSIPGQMLRR